MFALKAKETKRQYPHRLDKFLSFMELQGTIPQKCNELFEYRNKIEQLETYIIRFIISQRERNERKEISEGTICNYIKALKLFCSMNDIVVNWKKLTRGMPPGKSSANDRIPTPLEIAKLLKHQDRRIKVVALIMLSSGIRVGSWDHLRWKHVIPVRRNKSLVAAKIIVQNTKINNRIYYSFITPEAYNSLKEYMEFRELHGETITGESYLIRDNWQKVDRNHGHRIGLAKLPKKMNSSTIRNMIYQGWKVMGVRDRLPETERRHEFKSTHGFRKIFETRCQNARMNHNNIKILMDHSFGESENYHKPAEEDILEDYLHATEFLTISEENKLKLKLNQLTESQDEISEIRRQHTDEMNNLRQEMKIQWGEVMSMIRQNPNLAQIKPDALMKKRK
jgi:integrase